MDFIVKSESKTSVGEVIDSDDHNFNGNQLSSALEEVELGVDNEYNRKMNEIEVKRKEYLETKEKRRFSMAGQRRADAVIERQQIMEEIMFINKLKQKRANNKVGHKLDP